MCNTCYNSICRVLTCLQIIIQEFLPGSEGIWDVVIFVHNRLIKDGHAERVSATTWDTHHWLRRACRTLGSSLSPGFTRASSSLSSHTKPSPLLSPQLLRHESPSMIVAMPLRSLPRGPFALRGAREVAPRRTCGAGAGVGRITQRRWASEHKKMGRDDEKPFYLQLNESIYERVQKEKAEQLKIQSLQQRTARGQFFATVCGTSPSDTSIAAHTNH
jgi:hypothetical protein